MPKPTDPVAAWVEARGVRLEEGFEGETADPAAFAPLDGAVEGADLVFLGETDHFVHEKSDFRLLACRYLISNGWRAFAEELAWSDGVRLQRYLRDGDEAALDRLSLFGYRGDLRADRDDRPTGIFRASFDLYPVDLMRAEQGRFYRGLRRALNSGDAAYHGIDIDGLPGGGYADIRDRLSAFAAAADVAAFLHALERVPGETAVAESARLAALAPTVAALSNAIGADAAAEIDAALRAMAESLAYVEMTYPARTYEATAPGMAFREGCMKRRFDDLRRETKAAPTVVMGHALHLAKDDRLLGKMVGVGPGGGLECSIGHHLVQTLGLKTVSVWLIHGAGEDSQPFPDLPRRFSYPRDSLNARLSGFETPVLFPIAGAPAGLFDQPIGVGHMYNAVQPTVLSGQVDAILYLPRVSPMRA